MKTLTLIAILFSSVASAQKIENDTLYYNDHKFYEGKEIKLGYGSGPKKEFIFVYISGTATAEAIYSKTVIKIGKIYKTGGKYFVKGKGDKQKFYIDIEGAIDNKELSDFP